MHRYTYSTKFKSMQNVHTDPDKRNVNAFYRSRKQTKGRQIRNTERRQGIRNDEAN
ncbi:uncharacterized protein G2W53_019130 [Senna tora]|uniref:Uncharacterized protein n=1 Tax=Senna tora TaxID=362788 RepID=A0A834TX69_9FABA|nr:uncharacterized protein G2W53_019130 [Senna tora]